MSEDMPLNAAMSWSGLVVSLLLAATVVMLGGVWWAETKAFEQLDRNSPERLDDTSPANLSPAALLAMHQRELAWHPLAQDAVNRFLVAAHLSRQDDLVERIAAIMEDFAWRTGAGQLNLIALHLDDQEYAQIFDHGDALLRRNAAVEEIHALFSIYEQLPSERQRLVRKLEGSPPWRRAYLANTERLLNARQIEARYATLHQLLSKGPVGRDELASLLSPMVEIGAAKEAYDLWRMAEQPPLDSGNAVHDGDFRRSAALQDAGVVVRYPFEWELGSGRNSGAHVYREGEGSRLEIYWDGQGTPIFAKQVIKTGADRYRLTFQGFEGSQSAHAALGAELLCPNAPPISFVPTLSTNGKLPVLETDREPVCDFALLRIVGLADEAQEDIELSLTGIRVGAF